MDFEKNYEGKTCYARTSEFITKHLIIHYQSQFIKAALLSQLHGLLVELFDKTTQNCFSDMEIYEMDNKIIQMLIHTIVSSGEYSLEGIAHATRIPYDVIYDASYGKNSNFSITPWVRVVDLFLQIKPELAKLLYDKLLEKRNEIVATNISAMLAG